MSGARVDSYDRNAVRPLVGTLWVWEPECAPELIRVTSVRWNGEEWFVGSRAYLHPLGKEVWNDLSRFWEASHSVAVTPGPPRAAGATRRGVPESDEVVQ